MSKLFIVIHLILRVRTMFVRRHAKHALTIASTTPNGLLRTAIHPETVRGFAFVSMFKMSYASLVNRCIRFAKRAAIIALDQETLCRFPHLELDIKTEP
jgi:hypothetical protein